MKGVRRDLSGALGFGSVMPMGSRRVSRGQGGRGVGLLFIRGDDHGANAMGCFGGWTHRSPELGRLPREFDGCFRVNWVCAPGQAYLSCGSGAEGRIVP